MKCNLKFLSTTLILCALVTTATPAVQSYAANDSTSVKQISKNSAVKEFIYVEQTSKKQITSLEMKPEEKTDLYYLGAPKSKKYTYTWTSSDETVATVDKAGVVTAKKQGTAKITLTVGDGSVYTSEPVTVTVISMNVTLGNASNKSMSVANLKKNATLDLDFYGVTDWSTRKSSYITEWTTSDEAIVKVNQSNGVITGVSEGTALVVFHIYDMEKDVLLSSTPITVVVTK